MLVSVSDLAGGFPYHDTANIDILATLSAGQRLECPSNCSEEMYVSLRHSHFAHY